MAKLKLGNKRHSNGLFLAHCCNASYASKPGNSASFKKTNLNPPIEFQNQATAIFGDGGFVAESANAVVIVLQGTNDVVDWIKNFQFEKSTFLGSKVHKGFHNGMKSIKPGLLRALNQIPDWKTKPLFLTGHSRGGAIAVLMAQQLHQSFQDQLEHPISVFGFGSPRVGDANFFETYNFGDTTTLYIHEADPVPSMPPQLDGFVHVADQFVLHDKTVSELDIDSLIGLIERKHKTSVFPSPSDHKITSYVTAIKSIV